MKIENRLIADDKFKNSAYDIAINFLTQKLLHVIKLFRVKLGKKLIKF